MSGRKIKKIVRGFPTQDGAGVKLTRVVGNRDIIEFDPFLMLDIFDSTDPSEYSMGFPPHPHRGIETVTYLLEGAMEHGDSMGNRGYLEAGDCQWMTAGSGIIHAELPRAADRFVGLQLWLNLPQNEKMAPPKYRGIRESDIPAVRCEGSLVRVISGVHRNVPGALESEHVKVTFLDVSLEPGVSWSVATPHDATAFLYIFAGHGRFGAEEEIAIFKNALLFGAGDEIQVRSGKQGLRFVLCFADPLREPVAWGGPIVMNEEKEVAQAFQELQNGTFIKNETSA